MRQADTVILFDVDNTLLDNDSVIADLREYLERNFGTEACERYFRLFEQLRAELGYADYLGTLQRFRQLSLDDPRILATSFFLVDYPFERRLYPGSLDALAYASELGMPVILSDGDVVFQPRKVQRSGLWSAVDGRVLIYVHKEQMLEEVQRHYPARQYVMVDDKVRILAAVKASWGEQVITVFPRQGHYAFDMSVTGYPTPDVTVESIGDLVRSGLRDLLARRV